MSVELLTSLIKDYNKCRWPEMYAEFALNDMERLLMTIEAVMTDDTMGKQAAFMFVINHNLKNMLAKRLAYSKTQEAA